MDRNKFQTLSSSSTSAKQQLCHSAGAGLGLICFMCIHHCGVYQISWFFFTKNPPICTNFYQEHLCPMFYLPPPPIYTNSHQKKTRPIFSPKILPICTNFYQPPPPLRPIFYQKAPQQGLGFFLVRFGGFWGGGFGFFLSELGFLGKSGVFLGICGGGYILGVFWQEMGVFLVRIGGFFGQKWGLFL